MQAPAETRKTAWQPLTPRGIAAFADSSFGRLWLIQLLFASLAAGCFSWALSSTWLPVVRSAIHNLPDEGRIRAAQLEWGGDSVVALAENPFLSVVVDLNHQGTARSPAHVQLEFGRLDWRVLTVFGTSIQDYPAGKTISFNRRELEPWWGAWAPEFLALFALGVILGLWIVWTLLSCLYCLPAWLLGFFCDRQLSFPGSWRLAGAALMPAALLMTAAIVTYGRGVLTFLELSLVAVAHVIVGWTYVVLAILARPRCGPVSHNPFGSDPAPLKESQGAQAKSEG